MGTVHDLRSGSRSADNDQYQPPEPPDMDARIAKLESWAQHTDATLTDIKTDVREIRRDMRSDFRLLFGAIIAVAVGLAGLLAKGFHWL